LLPSLVAFAHRSTGHQGQHRTWDRTSVSSSQTEESARRRSYDPERRSGQEGSVVGELEVASSPCLVIEVDPTRCRVVGSNQDSGGRPAPPDVHLRTKRSSFSSWSTNTLSNSSRANVSPWRVAPPSSIPTISRVWPAPGANRVKMTPQSVPSWNFRCRSTIRRGDRRPSELDQRPNLMELTPNEFENLIRNGFRRWASKLARLARRGEAGSTALRTILGRSSVARLSSRRSGTRTRWVCLPLEIFRTCAQRRSLQGNPRSY